jgi:hypothetical protein
MTIQCSLVANSNGDRYSLIVYHQTTITLVGVKLVRLVQETVRNQEIRSLDLLNLCFESNTVDDYLEALLNIGSIESLYIRYSGSGSSYISSLAKVLLKKQEIKKLQIENEIMNDESLSDFGRAPENNATLTSLTIQSSR